MMQNHEQNIKILVGSGSIDASKELINIVSNAINIDDDGVLLASIIKPLNVYDKIEILNYFSDETDFLKILNAIENDIENDLIIGINRDNIDLFIQRYGYDAISSMLLELDNDKIIEVLSKVNETSNSEIVKRLPRSIRNEIKITMTYPEDSVGRFMDTDYISVMCDANVSDVIEKMHANKNNISDDMRDIFVTDNDQKIIGVLPILSLLTNKPDTKVDDIYDDDFKFINVNQDKSEIAYMFEKYRLITLPVVNNNNTVMGYISSDTAREITSSEKTEEVLKLSGITEDDIDYTMNTKIKMRFTWLLINLISGIVSSFVISNFNGVISSFSFLAALVPIVASMGGNSGMQTVAVIMRMMSLKNINDSNRMQHLGSECFSSLVTIALLSFVCFGFAMGISAMIKIPQDLRLVISLLFSMSVSINIILSTIIGFWVPIVMKKLNTDPAITSTVVLTTITDSMGFFMFLFLAKIMLPS
jgi:magnesium transporter